MSTPEVGGGGGGGSVERGSREVHKNGWLKRMPTQERRLSVMSPFAKPAKAEKLWVSFCVHDETEAWLEFYENRRSAFSHNPIHRTSLARCLHISPSIRVHEDNEHVFAITLEGEVIKLGAQNREQMMEWIDSMRSRLRELGVLTPKDNLYSKEPEGLRSPLLRNPNSPLPPTPTFQFPPHALEFRDEISSLHSMRMGLSPAPSMTLSTVSGLSGISGLSSMQSLNSVSSGSSDPNISPSSVVTYVRHHHEPPLNRIRKNDLNHGLPGRSSLRASLPSSPTTPAGGSGSLTFLRSPPGPQVSQPREHVTVISVSSPTASVFNFDTVGAALESSGSMANSQLYGAVYPTPESSICDAMDTMESAGETSYSTIQDPNAVQLRVGNSLGAGGGGGMTAGGRPPLPPGQRCTSAYGGGAAGGMPGGYSVGGSGMGASGGVGATSVAGGSWTNVSSESSYEPLFLAGTAGLAAPSTPTAPPVPQAPQTGLLRRRSEHRRSGRREHTRRAASVGPSIAPKQQQQQYQVGQDGRLMSLREQQVIRLQREINHQAGVRLTLRKKDCINSVAFVNVFNHVYVAGWKQREHPYLHNTFHIGDRLVSVCGVQVSCAPDAQNLIKNEPTMMVEFIIRRVPHGKVFALKRDTEGQPLGVIREGNTAEIKEIVPGGLAAQHGVPAKAPTIDNLSLCSWVLTEINHRPLNLFFKHMEIADRLNAVGRDISILIQPMDLVKQLKKALKAIKGYKDYIVM